MYPAPLRTSTGWRRRIDRGRWGWLGLRNGALLRALREAGFTHLITVDRNLAFQQNIAAAGVGVIVLVARTNRLADLTLLIRELIDRLPTVAPGEVVHLGK